MPDFSPATIVFPIADLERAKSVYTALLGEPYADTPYYVGYRAGGPEIALDPNGYVKGMTGPVVYWPCDDIRARLDELVAAGATLVSDAVDVGGGMKIGFVSDADGNHIGLAQSPAR